jgi:hypothetical protein
MHPLSWFLHTFTIPIFAEWNVGAIFRPCISTAARDSRIDYLRPDGQPYCKSHTLPHPRSSSALLRFRVYASWTWGRDVFGGTPCRLMYSHCRPVEFLKPASMCPIRTPLSPVSRQRLPSSSRTFKVPSLRNLNVGGVPHGSCTTIARGSSF